MTINGNHSQHRDDPVKPSKSSSSVTSNIGTALSVLTQNNKNYLSNSISLHGDVSKLTNAQTNDHHLSTSALNEVNSSSNNSTDKKKPGKNYSEKKRTNFSLRT